MMYFDGDATPLEGKMASTIQHVLYDRLFVPSVGLLCVGQKFTLVQYPIKSPVDVLSCITNVQSNEFFYNTMVKECNIAYGHIASRCDTLRALSVHYVETEPGYLPPGIKQCTGKKNTVPSEFIIELQCVCAPR